MIGIPSRSKLLVTSIEQNHVLVTDNEGQSRELPLFQADRFDVYSKHDLPIAKGDIIRITKNGKDAKSSRLKNGMLLKVKGFSKMG
ncbi:hypothetical protein QQ008_08950 [Fulvivirgaceae bacterium BMA10]|uniref:Uncharacterized protein n=1 Tax=Splendidivirga corallicola TaxID=3051826 RepID=A0ABT8KMN1_9BACT|nr:hypothetical protein [Fulvivirgaceae bacterium BMA10]